MLVFRWVRTPTVDICEKDDIISTTRIHRCYLYSHVNRDEVGADEIRDRKIVSSQYFKR